MREKVERGFTVITPPHYGVSLPSRGQAFVPADLASKGLCCCNVTQVKMGGFWVFMSGVTQKNIVRLSQQKRGKDK